MNFGIVPTIVIRLYVFFLNSLPESVILPILLVWSANHFLIDFVSETALSAI